MALNQSLFFSLFPAMYISIVIHLLLIIAIQ